MPIQLLPPEVASQIAAGEVIERPASVVKELLENSLDALSKLIQITIEGGGRRLIEISDDGLGIPSAELNLAVERHATSKLARADDLFQIRTLGFRGEALASIGSVARLTITSRNQNDLAGARLRVEGGLVFPSQPVGVPVGTTVRVEDLFFNLPARMKFMKSESAERQYIDHLVTRYALAYPDTRFSLVQEGRAALQTSGNGDRREVLAALYGVDTSHQMIEVISEDREISIHGFISTPSLTRSNRREIHFFINGRPVQDITLTTALLKAYHTLIMVGRFPMANLFLEIPPETVDVNVHPTKAEVRFRQPEMVFTAVQRSVKRALLAHSPVAGLGEPGFSAGPELRWTPQRLQPTEWGSALTEAGEIDASSPAAGTIPSVHSLKTSSPRVPILRLVGQIAASYLVAEGPDGLYLVDQHAAHERVLFEKMMAEHGDQIPGQVLLQPTVVELSPSGARLLTEQLQILSHLGFQVETFGPNTFLVRAIPTVLGTSDAAAALHVIVEDFEEDETPLAAELEARIIARVCKRAAVKAGQVLTPEEQRALLENLETCQSPRTCPHGRPTMIHLSVDLLERQFGRKGPR